MPLPENIKAQRRALALIGMGICIAAASVLFLFEPTTHSFYPVCALHRLTGLNCPGCGSLRAMHQLLHGHLGAALHYNALLVLALPFCGWFGARLFLNQWREMARPWNFRPCWAWLALALIIVFTIARNLPGGYVAALRL